MILSGAMMLRLSLGEPEAADRIEAAVVKVLDDGVRSADIGGGDQAVSTSEMAQAGSDALDQV
mgnify:CR=1 FL=1